MTEKKALRVQDYIEHMLRAIERIESYVHDLDQAAFERNTLVQDAVIRNFEIIGEVANRFSLPIPPSRNVTRSDRPAHRQSPAPSERLLISAALEVRRDRDEDREPYVSGDGRYGLSEERRDA